MLSRPQNSMTTRSRPTPAPPCGGAPYLHTQQGRTFSSCYGSQAKHCGALHHALERVDVGLDGLYGQAQVHRTLREQRRVMDALQASQESTLRETGCCQAQRLARLDGSRRRCPERSTAARPHLRPRDDFLPTNEDVKGAGVARVVLARHGVERADGQGVAVQHVKLCSMEKVVNAGTTSKWHDACNCGHGAAGGAGHPPVLYLSFTSLPSARSSSVLRSPNGSTCTHQWQARLLWGRGGR